MVKSATKGAVPLKKARPEAADPLAKVAGLPARPAAGTFPLHVAASLL